MSDAVCNGDFNLGTTGLRMDTLHIQPTVNSEVDPAKQRPEQKQKQIQPASGRDVAVERASHLISMSGNSVLSKRMCMAGAPAIGRDGPLVNGSGAAAGERPSGSCPGSGSERLAADAEPRAKKSSAGIGRLLARASAAAAAAAASSAPRGQPSPATAGSSQPPAAKSGVVPQDATGAAATGRKADDSSHTDSACLGPAAGPAAVRKRSRPAGMRRCAQKASGRVGPVRDSQSGAGSATDAQDKHAPGRGLFGVAMTGLKRKESS
jgi:hypothetical protein